MQPAPPPPLALLPGGTPTPPPANTPSPDPTVLGAAAMYHGCQVFPSGDYFNADVSTAAVDPASAGLFSHLPNLTAGNFPSIRYFQVNLATASTPVVALDFKHIGGYFPGITSVPWSAGFYISPLGDGHAVVVNTSNCMEYDYYQTSFSHGDLAAVGGRRWDLKQPMSAQFAPAWHTWGAVASDLPYMDLMLTGEDATGPSPIAHAIGFYFPTRQGVSPFGYFRPADAGTVMGVCAARPCLAYGDHLRLKASYVCPPSSQANRICKALKTYGMFYYDQANSFGFLFGASANGTYPWSGSDVDRLLDNLQIDRDFELLKRPALLCAPGRACSA